MKTRCRLLRTCLFLFTVVMSVGITMALAQSPPPDDPRMAGFRGKIAQKYQDSKEDWPQRPQAPADAPSILVILLDDTGYGQLGAYGGLIKTPNIDRLAAGGLT